MNLDLGHKKLRMLSLGVNLLSLLVSLPVIERRETNDQQ